MTVPTRTLGLCPILAFSGWKWQGRLRASQCTCFSGGLLTSQGAFLDLHDESFEGHEYHQHEVHDMCFVERMRQSRIASQGRTRPQSAY